jgi:tetratricopeptide (TPR) repeat protein
VVASGLALTARAQSASQAEIQLGVDAYNAGQVDAAIQHLRAAVAAEPADIRPKLFLAAVLMREYQPGNPQQTLLAAEARQQLLNVLSLDNGNKSALQSLLLLAVNTKELQQAREWAEKLIAIDPRETPAYYTLGFIDWSTSYPPYMAARAAAGMQPQDPGIIPDASLRLNLAAKISSQVEEGLRMLQTALDIDRQYTDALAYTNLLLRIKAAIVDTPAESADLTAQADAFVGKALAAKRAHAALGPAPSAEPKLNASGPAPGAAFAMAAPPPPPPPPPPAASERSGSYWQVAAPSGMSPNQAMEELRSAGFPVVEITRADNGQMRLVIGPYTDPTSLAQAKAGLQAAGFTPIRAVGR